MKVGCGQITWKGRSSSEDEILEDIKQAGYDGAPWHADVTVGSPAYVAEEVRASYAQHGLEAAPGYVWSDLWLKDRWPELLEGVDRYAAVSSALGLTELYVAAGGFDRVMPSGRTRRASAGHVRPDDQLSSDEFTSLAQGLNAAGAVAQSYGVRLCYHNHVGTVVETQQEVERMLALTDPALVFLGPDTGHLSWAGIDAVAFVRSYRERVLTMHVKDIKAEVRDQGRDLGWSYDICSDNGLFTELGDGCLELADLCAILQAADHIKWVIVETDVTQMPTALESAMVSRANLRKCGI